MAFENIRLEIDRLLAGISDKPEDLREIEAALREKLNEMKAFGMSLPADLVELEAALDQQLTDGDDTPPGDMSPSDSGS